MGFVHNSLGDHRKALDYYVQALEISRAVADAREEARALHSIGSVYNSLGKQREAIEFNVQALPLSHRAGDRRVEGAAISDLSLAYSGLGNPRLAIFFGKQAVNIYQQVRSDIHGFETDAQKSYLRSVETTYRTLAELLFTQGRLVEAQQVLNAFKNQQFLDIDKSQSIPPRLLKYTPHEAEVANKLDRLVSSPGGPELETRSALEIGRAHV